MKKKKNNNCGWIFEDNDGYYYTECNNSFVLIEGNLEENNFKFCVYCGGRIILKQREIVKEENSEKKQTVNE